MCKCVVKDVKKYTEIRVFHVFLCAGLTIERPNRNLLTYPLINFFHT